MLRMVVAILLAINLALLLWLLRQPAQPEPPVVGGDLKLLSEVTSLREGLPEPQPEPEVVAAPKNEPAVVATPVPQAEPPLPKAEVAEATEKLPATADPAVAAAQETAGTLPAVPPQQPPVASANTDSQTAPATPEQPPEPSKPPEKKLPESYCYAYGPMPDQPAGLPVLSEIRRKFPDAQLRQEGQEEKGVFWVLIESAKTDIESVQLEERLRAAGINDIWRVTRGDRRNAVSMGVFNQKENADKKVAEAKERGFDAKVVNKHKEGRGFWVEFTSERNTLTPATLGVAANADRSLRIHPCAANGQAPVQSH